MTSAESRCLFVPVLFALSYCHCTQTEFSLVRAGESRNVIFVGGSRSGKTMLIEALKNKTCSPKLSTFIRVLMHATFKTFTMTDSARNLRLNFNMMDAPGPFERTRTKEDARMNEVILDVIMKCINMEMTKMNHVYFALSGEAAVNEQDVKAFITFTE